jgi:hypothetical protein
MVFLNSPCRETPKNLLKKKCQEKKVGWGGGLGFSKCPGGSVDFLLAGPSVLRQVSGMSRPSPSPRGSWRWAVRLYTLCAAGLRA